MVQYIEKKQSCKLCSDGTIENEIHLLLNCPAYKNLRYCLFLRTLQTDQIDLIIETVSKKGEFYLH